MKSLLAISWWFPPLLGPRSTQVGKSLSILANRGWQISVVTSGTSSLPLGTNLDSRLIDKYCSELSIYRVESPWQTPFRQVVGKVIPSQAPAPDPQIYWALKAAKSVPNQIGLASFDGMISFGQPFSVHLLAQQIAQQSRLPWLAHFSDPWADNPYINHLPTEEKTRLVEWEHGVVKHADALLFTNQPTVDLVMGKYPAELQAKAGVVPHGFDTTLMSDLPVVKFQRSAKKLTLLHSGNIYGIRNPQALFDSLVLLRDDPQVLDDLDLVFVGAISHKSHWLRVVRQRGLRETVRFIGRVGYFESLAIGQEVDVLITLDAASDTESVFLPSKLVEYLALGKPILGLTPQRGVSADLLRSLNMPVADPRQPTQIAEALKTLHALWKQGKLVFNARSSAKAQHYQIETTTDLLEKALRKIIS